MAHDYVILRLQPKHATLLWKEISQLRCHHKYSYLILKCSKAMNQATLRTFKSLISVREV